MTKKTPKPKKQELVNQLLDSLSQEQWELIEQLLGRTIKDSRTTKHNLLNNLFHKTIARSTAKSKGRSLQQWLERQIGECLDEPYGKDTEIASRPMGQTGPDVGLSPRIRELFPFTAECKSGDQWNIPSAIQQCIANLYDGTNWMICIDRPHQLSDKRILPIIIIQGETFFKIFKELQRG